MRRLTRIHTHTDTDSYLNAVLLNQWRIEQDLFRLVFA